MRYDPDDDARLERERIRAESLEVPCPFCHAYVNNPCINVKNGAELWKIPAHLQRYKAAEEAKT